MSLCNIPIKKSLSFKCVVLEIIVKCEVPWTNSTVVNGRLRVYFSTSETRCEMSVCNRYPTVRVGKRVRGTSLYHPRQCGIVIKPRPDCMDYTRGTPSFALIWLTTAAKSRENSNSASWMWFKYALSANGEESWKKNVKTATKESGSEDAFSIDGKSNVEGSKTTSRFWCITAICILRRPSVRL